LLAAHVMMDWQTRSHLSVSKHDRIRSTSMFSAWDWLWNTSLRIRFLKMM